MSKKGLSLKFIVEEKNTEVGEDIYLKGSAEELGNWKTNIKLSGKNHPKWESDIIPLNNNYSSIEYKYYLLNLKKEVKWENFNGNRKLDISNYTEGTYVIDSGNFSDKDSLTIIPYDEYMEKKENKDNYNNIENNKEEKELNNITNKYDYEKDNNIDNNKFDENEKSIEKAEKEIINIDENTNKIGLQNIGSTCYMNATLQCFLHIKKFINFFKKRNINSFPQEFLSYSFKFIIDNLWKDDFTPNQNQNNYFAPKEFRQKIAQKSELFKNNEANDAKDLVNFIIMTLHEELNEAKNIPNYNNNINNFMNGINMNQTNKLLAFKAFTDEYKQKNKSIINELFYAINLSVTQCSICKNQLYNYQLYYFIVFPLEEIRKYKYQNYMNNMNNFNFMNNNFNNNFNNEVSIYDCFDYEQKVNFMNGANQMHCNFCKTTCDSLMYTNLITGPDTLILLLNRGKGIEFKVKINFEEYLNLQKYIELKDTGYYYELFGVITHIGESGQGGHFIAYCRDPYTNIWSKFNDAIVTKVNDFHKEIINFANPYLLFYQKLIS